MNQTRSYYKSPHSMFVIDHSTVIPLCLPTSLDRSRLIEITIYGDSWRVFLDQEGNRHDGALYFQWYQELCTQLLPRAGKRTHDPV